MPYDPEEEAAEHASSSASDPEIDVSTPQKADDYLEQARTIANENDDATQSATDHGDAANLPQVD